MDGFSRARADSGADERMVGYIYLLEYADEALYVRSTRDVKSRLAQHISGERELCASERSPAGARVLP